MNDANATNVTLEELRYVIELLNSALSEGIIIAVLVAITVISYRLLRIYELRYWKKVMLELAPIARDAVALDYIRTLIKDIVSVVNKCEWASEGRFIKAVAKIEQRRVTMKQIFMILLALLITIWILLVLGVIP